MCESGDRLKPIVLQGILPIYLPMQYYKVLHVLALTLDESLNEEWQESSSLHIPFSGHLQHHC